MANNKFTFTCSKQPAKSRSKDLQNVSGTTATTSANVGVPSQTITQVINNITNVVGDAKQPQPITLEDFEALTNVEVNDLYIVYSSGSASEGWHTGDTFEYDGETYDDGTWFLRNELGWQTVDGAAYQKGQTAIFNPMPERLHIITSTAASTSFNNLPYSYKAGIEIGQAAVYKWNAETSQYEPDYDEEAYYKSNTKTLFIPYARSYWSGGQMRYAGGALTPGDYEKFITGGGSIEIETRTTLDPANNCDFVGRDQEGLFGASLSLLYNWFRVNNNLPYFYTGHTANTVPSSLRNKPGLCVATDGFWWYNGNTWRSVVPQSYGICIDWYVSGETNYFAGTDRQNVTLEDYATTGGYSFTLSIDGLTDAGDVKQFLREHVAAVTMTGDNNGTYQQANLTALSSFTLVEYAGKTCVKITLPNRSYYYPTDDDDTYFSIKFISILE